MHCTIVLASPHCATTVVVTPPFAIWVSKEPSNRSLGFSIALCTAWSSFASLVTDLIVLYPTYAILLDIIGLLVLGSKVTDIKSDLRFIPLFNAEDIVAFLICLVQTAIIMHALLSTCHARDIARLLKCALVVLYTTRVLKQKGAALLKHLGERHRVTKVDEAETEITANDDSEVSETDYALDEQSRDLENNLTMAPVGRNSTLFQEIEDSDALEVEVGMYMDGSKVSNTVESDILVDKGTTTVGPNILQKSPEVTKKKPTALGKLTQIASIPSIIVTNHDIGSGRASPEPPVEKQPGAKGIGKGAYPTYDTNMLHPSHGKKYRKKKRVSNVLKERKSQKTPYETYVANFDGLQYYFKRVRGNKLHRNGTAGRSV